MRFPGQIETPYLRGLICILTSIIPQDAKQEMRQSTGSACGRGRGRGRGRGKRTVNTGNPIASTMVAPRRSRRMLERRDGNPMPPGPPGSQGSGTSAPGPPEPPKPMDGSGQYDSKESLPDPEKGTDASPGDAEDSPWSPPGSLVEDEADSGSDSDEEEGDNEYGEENWELWNEYLGKGTKAETVAECNDPPGESEEMMDADEEGDHVAPDAGLTDEEADEEVAYEDADRETDQVAEGNDPAGESEERMEAGLVAPDAGLTGEEDDEDLVFFDADNPVVPEPRVGMTFPFRDMAERYGRAFFDGNLVATCTPQNNEKTLWVACVHFGKFRSRCKGNRPDQFSIKMQCPAVIKFYTLESTGMTRIKFFDLTHNHPVDERWYKADTRKANAESRAVIKNLMKARCKVNQISDCLREAGNQLSRNQIRYQMEKLKDEAPDPVVLSEFLDTVKDANGLVEAKMDEEDVLDILTVVTQPMKRAYTRCRPGVVQMDCTYGTNRSAYKLLAILYPSNVTGHGEVAMFAWMRDETAASFEYVFQSFKRAYQHIPSAIMVDKDFTQLRALKKQFPTVSILLCYFHVAAYVEKIIKSANVKQDKKEEIRKAFSELTVAREEKFKEKEVAWIETIEGVQVTPTSGGNTVALVEYYQKNWAGDEDLWAHYRRRHLPLGRHFTNNMVERLFRTVKDMLESCNPGHIPLGRSVQQAVEFCDDRLDERLLKTQRKIMVAHHSDPMVMELLNKAAAHLGATGVRGLKKAMDLMQQTKENMLVLEDVGVKESFSDGEEPKTYKTTAEKCTCTRWMQHQYPCKHILLWRQVHNLDLFQKDIFHDSYHLDRFGHGDAAVTFPKEMADDVPGDLQDYEWPEEDPGSLTENEKIGKVKAPLEQIQQWLRLHGTPQVLSYAEELWEISERIRRGERLIDRCEECGERLIDGCDCAISKCDEEFACMQDQEGEESVAPRAGMKYTPKCNTRGRPTKRRGRHSFKAANDEDKAAQPKAAKRKGAKGAKDKGPKEKYAKVHKGNKRNSNAKGKVLNARKAKPVGKKATEKKPEEKVKTGDETVTLSDTEYASEQETSNGKQAVEDWAIKIAGKDEPLKHGVVQMVFCKGDNANNDATVAEFSTLARGKYVSDGPVNWWLMFFVDQFSKFHPEEKQVLVLSTEFFALLRSTKWPESWDTPPECLRNRLDEKLALYPSEKDDNMGGYRFIVQPLVERGHYYVLVYITDAERPQLVVLESMGNDFARSPVGTDKFIKLLKYYRKQWNMKQVVVEKSVPAVPRQEAYSNDCALFAITFIEHLLMAPANFEDLLNKQCLHSWFHSDSVRNKREQLIATMIRESRDQRKPGYPTFFTLSSRGMLIQNFRRSNGRPA